MSRDVQNSILVRFEETDVAALLRSSLTPLIQQAKEQHIELRVETLGDVPPLSIDNEKLAWAVSALVGNALRFVRRGSAERAGGSVLVHIVREPKEISIAIQDDGPGIPKEKLPFLFERRSGSPHADGLALSLVRDIVAAHGGRIEVESRTGPEEHGTSIAIRVPHSR